MPFIDSKITVPVTSELKEEINPSSSKKSSFQLALLKADLEVD